MIIDVERAMKRITRKQQERVAELLQSGLTQKETAEKLGLGIATVQRYGKDVDPNEPDIERRVNALERRMNSAEDNIEELFVHIFERDELGSNNRLADKLLIIGKE